MMYKLKPQLWRESLGEDFDIQIGLKGIIIFM